MKSKKIILIGLMALLSGCAADKQMFYKDGQQVHVLTCSGPTFTGCLEKASNICQAIGYDVLDRVSVRQSGMFSSTDHKEMVIACKTKSPATVDSRPSVSPGSSSAPNTDIRADKPSGQ